MPSHYRIADPSDVRDLGETIAEWAANGNPKAGLWAEVPPKPHTEATWGDGQWLLPTLGQMKSAKLAEIDAAWQGKVAAGWTPPGEDFSLGIDIADVTLLLGAYTLAKDAASLGLPNEVAIIDTAGNSHAYDAQSLTPLMLQYGAARAAMSAADAALRAAVAAAQTPEEVAEIEVT